MNTLQLTRAMRQDPFAKKYFLGVFPSDRLPERIRRYPSCFIANVDPSHKIGRHWIAFFISSEDTVEFFDSYGQPWTAFPDSIANYAKKFSNVNYNPLTLQTNFTDVCGQYCLFYLYNKCRKIPLKRMLSSFVTAHICNDVKVYKFVLKRFRVRTNFFQ